MKTSDVIIVGAGPAGLFSAIELAEAGIDVTLIEKGPDLKRRKCPALDYRRICLRCPVCPLISGFGGAGAFSDGKITLSHEIGGNLRKYIEPDSFIRLMNHVDQRLLEFGAPRELYGTDDGAIKRIKYEAQKNGLLFVPTPIRHLGTDGGFKVLEKMRNYVEKLGIDIHFNERVEDIVAEGGEVNGVRTNKDEYRAKFVIVAPGRAGATWMAEQARKLKLETYPNPVDIGVRVELPASIMDHLTKVVYEPKLVYYSQKFDDKIRTFCVNPNGVVVQEFAEDVITVNGFSNTFPTSENTNFALLVSTSFTEPFKDPISFGKSIVRLANLISGGVLLQRLGDLMRGRRSTDKRISKNPVKPTLESAIPGDISFVLPYRYLVNLIEMLEALDKIAPGVASPYTLLYGVEVKFYSNRVKVNKALETDVKGLFTIGDGAGITRGLLHSAISGLVAASEIKRRTGIRNED